MKRFGLLSGTTLVLLLANAAAGWACNPPEPEITAPNPAYPGDTVYIGIIGLTNGADYTVRVGNQVVLHRTAADANVSDSFPVPDLGPSSTTFSVEVTAEHADIENDSGTLTGTSGSNLHYGGDTRPASEPAPQATSDPSPAATPVESAPQHSDPLTAAPPSAPATGGRPLSTPRPSGGGPTHAVQPRQHQTRQAPRRASNVRAPATLHRGAVIAPPAASPDATLPVRVPTAEPRFRHAAVQQVPTAAPLVLARPEVAVTGVARTALHASRHPASRTEATRDLVLLALASAAALALLLMRRRGWGRPHRETEPDPGPPDDGIIEAELQAMIAQEQARAERELSGVP